MQVSEQTDMLRVLGAHPVDYLVTPRVIACCVAMPILALLCFTIGMSSSALLADRIYGVSIRIILDSAQRALRPWDIMSAMIKSQVFGGIVAIMSCAWGVTTLGGAKGVGEVQGTRLTDTRRRVDCKRSNGCSDLSHHFICLFCEAIAQINFRGELPGVHAFASKILYGILKIKKLLSEMWSLIWW
ncbi:hypothetical protein AAC387_Pa06g0360 [Persea americana]